MRELLHEVQGKARLEFKVIVMYNSSGLLKY